MSRESKIYFAYEEADGSIGAKELLSWLLKDTIGTMFIEPDKIHNLTGSRMVGRTYFRDRLKYDNSFNRASSSKIYYVFEEILSGKSSYDALDISRRLSILMKKRLFLRMDFLQFFADDTDVLRQSKAQDWCMHLSSLAYFMEDKTAVSLKDLHAFVGISIEKMFLKTRRLSGETHTSLAVQKVAEEAGYPLIITRTPAVPAEIPDIYSEGPDISSYDREISQKPDMPLRIWNAAQRDLLQSHKKGSRFASLNIIQALLPKGYIAESHFEAKGTINGGRPERVMDLCMDTAAHIAVVGDGGIGKTTFLHQIMLNEYWNDINSISNNSTSKQYRSNRPVPVFIELNRCPESIRGWRNDTLRKSNFITRYIGQLLEDHLSMDAVSPETLSQIEKEFQRTPRYGAPEYLLLLDGFNEVRSSAGHSIRSELSNEITVLSSYPNVRIITTSRETQAAYYAEKFTNIKLTGLEDEDIVTYLKECEVDHTTTGLVKANKNLMSCLRNPLNLSMFCADKDRSVLPETQGEIFYNFFHRNGSFYNIRRRAEETMTNVMDRYQTAFILDFVLPFIGWNYERIDTFSVNRSSLFSLIRGSISAIEALCHGLDSLPYQDFEYDPVVLSNTVGSFRNMGESMEIQILDYIHGFLGLLYLNQFETGNYADRNRYLFCHHQFRDYFSAIWDIQMLTLLQCIPIRDNTASVPLNGYNDAMEAYVNDSFWSTPKAELISQILMEHKNRPILDVQTAKWSLPIPCTDEQKVLKKALDFCRSVTKLGTDIHFLLQNVLSAIEMGRGELSGEDLHGLDFRSCNFFNVRCSRSGISNTLAADFSGSRFYEECFRPQGHDDIVVDFVYNKRFCYTLDGSGTLKCWDVLSGKPEYELDGADPGGLNSYSPDRILKISQNGRWLAVKIQNPTKEGIEIGVELIELDTQGYMSNRSKIVMDAGKHHTLDGIFFTGDLYSVLLLCDSKVVYCYNLNDLSLKYSREYSVLVSGSILFAENANSPIYAFTGDFDPSEFQDWYTETYIDEEDGDNKSNPDIDVPEDGTPITCHIYLLFTDSDESIELYRFSGAPGTSPTAAYLPDQNGFLIFNYKEMALELFSFKDSAIIMTNFGDIIRDNDMPPSHFHPATPGSGQCYIMFPDCFYLADLSCRESPCILTCYSIEGVAKLLPDGNVADELYFKTSVAPVNGHFIVTNDNFVYEWDSEHDYLYTRYNVAYFETSGLISDEVHNTFILIHQNNGLTIFDGDSYKLSGSITFREDGYNLTLNSFEPQKRLLALVFSRPDHEKTVLLNLSTGEQKYCFSTQMPNETILSCSFDDMGGFLLLLTQYACYEYEIVSGRLWHVSTADEAERYVGGNYAEKGIEIAIVPHKNDDEEKIVPRCVRYNRCISEDACAYTYKQMEYYILPELSGVLYQRFIYQNNDLGAEGTHDQNGIQKYWVTQGFFYPPENESCSFTMPFLNIFDPDGRITQNGVAISPFQMIYFRHTHVLRRVYELQKDSASVNYAYLDEKSGESVFIENNQNLFYCPDYKKASYHKIKNAFQKKIGSYDGHA
ncbi:MAG: hypothetical protein K6G83_07820, partial [Lachnospiraceae bacterium]|nr:hypothetical protein [Lachnospiraceae bacterium]